MIVVVLKTAAPRPESGNVELRMMIEGMTTDEGEALGQAIHEFAVKMKRRETMSAFSFDNELRSC